MVEVRDNNSNAILFKRSPQEKKVEDLEDKVEKLEHIINVLLSREDPTHEVTSSSTSIVGDVSNR